jgi:hypothetical protein
MESGVSFCCKKSAFYFIWHVCASTCRNVARATLSPAQTCHLTAKFAHDGLRVGLMLPLVLHLVRLLPLVLHLMRKMLLLLLSLRSTCCAWAPPCCQGLHCFAGEASHLSATEDGGGCCWYSRRPVTAPPPNAGISLHFSRRRVADLLWQQ